MHSTPPAVKSKDINIIFGLNEHIHASVGRVAFYVSIEAQQLENKAGDIVEIQLRVANDLVVLVGKHGFEARHELFGLAVTHLNGEVFDKRIGFVYFYGRIISKQESRETSFHFSIGEAQSVGAEIWVVIFNGQITTLIE